MIGKTTVFGNCIHKRVKSIVFTMSIKFFDESGQTILRSKCQFQKYLFKHSDGLLQGCWLCSALFIFMTVTIDEFFFHRQELKRRT